MTGFILDASFALRWCFEDEATAASESTLTMLQNQEGKAWVPGIWPLELLNGLGKGVTRGRIKRERAFLLWQEIRELPIHIVDVPVNEQLLELALQYNLAIYDTSYLSLAVARSLPIATGDEKLQNASESAGIKIIKP